MKKCKDAQCKYNIGGECVLEKDGESCIYESQERKVSK